MKKELIVFSSLLVLSTTAFAQEVCISADNNYYRINYTPGSTGIVVNPGRQKIDLKNSENGFYDWNGGLIGTLSNTDKITEKQMITLSPTTYHSLHSHTLFQHLLWASQVA